MSYYRLLGVPREADAAEIRKAFRTLARRYHPDAGQGSSAEKFRHIALAYETLSDPARRLRYDRTLAPRPVPRTPFAEPMIRAGGAEPLHGPRPIEILYDRSSGAWEDVVFDVFRALFLNRRY